MSMVRLERFTRHSLGLGEDDGAQVHGAPIAINPVYVAALFESVQEPGSCIIRLADGRGFAVRGSYEQVATALGLEAEMATDEVMAAQA